jgi:hypothetical protein
MFTSAYFQLQVAYVSRVMSKNFRKEGQPEKERLAKITGMDIDKVSYIARRVRLINFQGIWHETERTCI